MKIDNISQTDKLHFLQTTPIFFGLSSTQLDFIAAAIKEITFEDGDTIVQENESGDQIYIIYDGEVEIRKAAPHLKTAFQIAILKKGTVFGEIALFGEKNRSASALARGQTRIFSLSTSFLKDLQQNQSPDSQLSYYILVENLAKIMATRMRSTNDEAITALNHKLTVAKARIATGILIITVMAIISLYTVTLGFLKKIQLLVGLGTPLFLIVSVILVLIAIKQTGYPQSLFGLNFNNWRKVCKEALIFTIPLLLLVIFAKWLYLISYASHGAERHIFEFFQPQTSGETRYIKLALALYILFIPLQEFIVRGVLQTSLTELLTARYKTAWAILLSNLLFAASHMHISLLLTLASFLAGIFWGWLYARQHTLLGVVLSHWITAIWALFIVSA